MANKNRVNIDAHTYHRDDVFKSELDYINKRRRDYDLEELSDKTKPWGICFSGGGIRSATLCLGIMQKLIKKDLFKRFDYLSSVSGGGYIGSCLTSLLSKPENFTFKNAPETGVEPKNSPFVELNILDGHKDASSVRLGVWHQLHHLRTHGEYLISQKGLLTRDVQRAIGTLIAGIMHHFVLFGLVLISLTALLHFFLFSITGNYASTQQKQEEVSPLVKTVPFLSELNYLNDTYYKITDKTLHYLEGKKVSKDIINQLLPHKDKVFYEGRENFMDTVREITTNSEYQQWIEEGAKDPKESQLSYVINEMRTWLYARLGIPLKKMLFDGIKQKYIPYIVTFFIGIILWIIPFYLVKKVELNIYQSSEETVESAKSGFNIEDHYESKFITYTNMGSFLFITLWALIYGIWNSSHNDPNNNYLAALFLPVGYSVGAMLTSFSLSNYLRSKLKREDRVRRSLFNGIQGAAFYSILYALFMPILIVFLFSINYFEPSFWWALTSLAFGYFIFRKSGKVGDIKQILAKFYKILLTLLLLLFTALVFNLISDTLIRHVYPSWSIAWTVKSWTTNLAPFVICLGSALVIGILGMIINSNRISPHYFYRDRLTETYLKTDARILRGEKYKKDQQGMPVVSVRNHENLKLSELGDNNNRGPYHIIVAALNLQGSDELNRKTMLSEHFIFSKYYVGSKVTGYVRTEKYRNDKTKLARAMTISAAAAGSAMGFHSFGAQAFATTLFNVRLGYWMANPWYYVKDNENPEPKRPFWPRWLMLELLNKMTARETMVNLSDGGHTGDNLGLLPLLQRRCKVIVVCDGEADKNYNFNSFNNAVRMAYIEENIEIDIDLSKIVPEKNKDGSYKLSKKSVAIGKIIYNPVKKGEKKTTGTLIYLKSSMSENDTSECEEEFSMTDEKLPQDEAESSVREHKKHLPAHVINYKNENSDFPHQTTADQFFDDAQFEAYRALGEHIAGQAIEKSETLQNLCKDMKY